MSNDSKVEPELRVGDDQTASDRLIAKAADSVRAGDAEQAIAALLEAHAGHLQAGRRTEAAHCACQAATIARLGGALDRAASLASIAQDCAGDDDEMYLAATIERAEIELLAERPGAAAQLLHSARERSRDASRELDIALAMKHAESLYRAGDSAGAEDAWTSAESMAQDGDQLATLLVRRATLLQENKSPVADAAIVRAKLVAQSAGNRRVLAGVALLECAAALALGERDVAIRAARNARKHALASDAVMDYVSAAVILSRLHAQNDAREDAYRCAAVGWARVSERVGEDLARASFAPLLTQLRSAWGEASFAEIKNRVEEG